MSDATGPWAAALATTTEEGEEDDTVPVRALLLVRVLEFETVDMAKARVLVAGGKRRVRWRWEDGG